MVCPTTLKFSCVFDAAVLHVFVKVRPSVTRKMKIEGKIKELKRCLNLGGSNGNEEN
jgi:hypothetical protein